MVASDPQQAVEMLDEAFNRGDVEAALDLYDDEAVLVAEPGRLARGKSEIRRALEHVIGLGMSAQQGATFVLEADGTALFLSRWTLTGPGPGGGTASQQFVATSVLRTQEGGGWRLLIDNAFGPAVLGGAGVPGSGRSSGGPTQPRT